MPILRFLLLSLALVATTPAFAAPVTVTKTASTYSDPLNTLLPKGIPGATIEYKAVIANATGNPSASGVVFVETLPVGVTFCLGSIDPLLSPGPVLFTDLSTLASSGLTFPYSSVTSTTDNLDFSKDNGLTWTYQPNTALACDPAITRVRVRFAGTFLANKSVQLRYRALVK